MHASQLAVKIFTVISRAYFYLTALRHPRRPKPGFTLVGPFTATGSLGKVMRDLATSLAAVGIPVQTWSTTIHKDKSLNLSTLPFTPWWKFSSRLYSHVLEMFDSNFPAEKLGLQRLTIAFWEFTTGLSEAHPTLLHKQHIIAMSDFNLQVFKASLPNCRVSKLLYPFQMQSNIPSRREMRDRFGIGQADFMVFFNFDYGSSYCRKNPEAVLRAFAKAFPTDTTVKLVFKTMNARSFRHKEQVLKNLAHGLHVENRLIIIDTYLTQSELYGLTTAADVYVSLHRGEGFGLGIAEAMYLSKPAIVTDFSSTTEFCTPQSAIPIPYTLTPIPDKEDHPFLRHVETCAEPNIDAAAKALVTIRNSPTLCKQIGQSAHEFICQHFSLQKFKASASELLEVKTA